MVEMGILGFSNYIWGDRDINKRVPRPTLAKGYAGNTTLGKRILEIHGLNFPSYFYWISLAALFGFALFFNIGFVLALAYFKSPGPSRAIISKKKLSQVQGSEVCHGSSCPNNDSTISAPSKPITETKKTEKMVLPFQPLTVAFKDVQYFVDTLKPIYLIQIPSLTTTTFEISGFQMPQLTTATFEFL